LVKKYTIRLRQKKNDTFFYHFYSQHIRDEIDFVFERIKEIKDIATKKIISIVLSRTIRSCRATTHADLATLLEPVTTSYYCSKHGKICKPLFSIMKWWKTYSKDTISRLQQFDKLRTNTFQLCITGDSRNMDILEQVKKKNTELGKLLERQKIQGIFSSPPYVGLIDYHEQHAYAYDLFGFARKDELEIGPLFKGQKREAQLSYIQGISDVLNNCKRFLADDYSVFLVANDKFNMYPTIAQNAGMTIVNQFKRPVLNRTEKDKTAYSETIFHLKGGNYGTNKRTKRKNINRGNQDFEKRFESFPEDASNNSNAPFHEAFLNAFSNKIAGRVSDTPFFIRMVKWLHGLNTTLGQSFFEKVSHILCNGEKREYTSKMLGNCNITQEQKNVVNQIITDLSTSVESPNLISENAQLFQDHNSPLVRAIDFLTKFQLLRNNSRRFTPEYHTQLQEWNLFSEKLLIDNKNLIQSKLNTRDVTRTFHNISFDSKGNYNWDRYTILRELI
jgi:hypothetical protein